MNKLYSFEEMSEIFDELSRKERNILHHNIENHDAVACLKESINEYEMGLITTGELVDAILDLTEEDE